MTEHTANLIDAALSWAPPIAGRRHGGSPALVTPENDPVEPMPEEILAQGSLGNVAVLRPRLCQRKGVYFISCRQWFAPAKLQGINLLKAAKDSMDPQILEDMAIDVAKVATLVYGPFEGIVTAPSARHSAFSGKEHFATAMAKIVAERLGAKHSVLFEITAANRKGHHPAREKDPPKVIAKNLPVNPRILLVDDMATSGMTLEWHAKALESAGAKVCSLVWCYGSTAGTGRGS